MAISTLPGMGPICGLIVCGLLSSCANTGLSARREAVARLGPQTTRNELFAVIPPAGSREFMLTIGNQTGFVATERYPTQDGFMVEYECLYRSPKPPSDWAKAEMDLFLFHKPLPDRMRMRPDPDSKISDIRITRSTGKKTGNFFKKVPSMVKTLPSFSSN